MWDSVPEEMLHDGQRYVPSGIQTCFHEAGHAVAAYLMKVPFKSVRVTPTKRESKGRVVLSKAVDAKELSRDKAEQHILVCLAGEAAEALVTETPVEKLTASLGYGRDWQQALMLALPHCHEDLTEAAAYITFLRIRVRNILAQPNHWRAVTAVAHQLYHNGRLGVRRTVAIIEEFLRDDTQPLKYWWERTC